MHSRPKRHNTLFLYLILSYKLKNNNRNITVVSILMRYQNTTNITPGGNNFAEIEKKHLTKFESHHFLAYFLVTNFKDKGIKLQDMAIITDSYQGKITVQIVWNNNSD